MGKVRILTGYHAGKDGKIVSKIPGGNHFKVLLDDGKTTALKESEFERIKENTIPFNEGVAK